MPKTYITEAARKMAEYEKLDNKVMLGLIRYKAFSVKRKRALDAEEMAKELGIGRSTLLKLLNGEKAQLPLSKWCRVLEAAGYEIVRRAEE